MRILHAVRSDGFAGVERHVATLARAQASAGHDLVVVGGAAGPTTRAAGPAVRHRLAATTADVVRALVAEASGRSGEPPPHVVHVHMTAAEVAATLAGLRVRLPPVVSTRHFALPRGSGPAGRAVAAVARRRVAAQVAISEHVAARVDGASVVVRPGVAPRHDALPAAARDRVVLMAQRLEPEKRTDLGVRAFADSGLADRRWRLQVAGDGSQAAATRALADELGVGHAVDLLGARDDVESLMRRASLLLAPCPVEGLGLTVVEGMAAGLPVVAAGAGGHLETLGGLDPLALYPPGEPGQAATRLARLATDPARRDAYARAAQARQRHEFTPGRQAADVLAVYRAVLERAAPAPAHRTPAREVP
ncbi:glycosyltransferase family 4 protein [Isoptericola sp. BMS4]|uniref:glycosyltransferase family 4 protein n=1 Tax=Isoptericola sp. BMS4 TaxID=2527875 RepID=UPI001422324A|nr:glycosyltransferase family 4 protein [Isoptericola sp. BMS4]